MSSIYLQYGLCEYTYPFAEEQMWTAPKCCWTKSADSFGQMFTNAPCPCALLPTLQQNIQHSVNKDRARAVQLVFGMCAIQQVYAKLH